MTTDAPWPVLFLDVDGPLIPIGTEARPTADAADKWDGVSNPLLARLDPAHGGRLSALGCELVWATTWMSDANEDVAPRIGLPELPVVGWPDDAEDEQPAGCTGSPRPWSPGRPAGPLSGSTMRSATPTVPGWMPTILDPRFSTALTRAAG